MIFPVIIALIVFALSMSLFSLFIAGLVRRPLQDNWRPDNKLGYYSLRENRRVYREMETH